MYYRGGHLAIVCYLQQREHSKRRANHDCMKARKNKNLTYTLLYKVNPTPVSLKVWLPSFLSAVVESFAEYSPFHLRQKKVGDWIYEDVLLNITNLIPNC